MCKCEMWLLKKQLWCYTENHYLLEAFTDQLQMITSDIKGTWKNKKDIIFVELLILGLFSSKTSSVSATGLHIFPVICTITYYECYLNRLCVENVISVSTNNIIYVICTNTCFKKTLIEVNGLFLQLFQLFKAIMTNFYRLTQLHL